VNDPQGSRLHVVVEARLFICPALPSKTHFLLRSSHDASAAVERLHRFWLLVTGGFLVIVLAQGQQPPSIRVGQFDRTRPMPYASVTLSGSRERKQTHLFFGEPNSCQARLRPFPQSQQSVSIRPRVILLLRRPRAGPYGLPTQTGRIVALASPRRHFRALRRHAALQIAPQRHQ
jgi:hypothetical protein